MSIYDNQLVLRAAERITRGHVFENNARRRKQTLLQLVVTQVIHGSQPCKYLGRTGFPEGGAVGAKVVEPS